MDETLGTNIEGPGMHNGQRLPTDDELERIDSYRSQMSEPHARLAILKSTARVRAYEEWLELQQTGYETPLKDNDTAQVLPSGPRQLPSFVEEWRQNKWPDDDTGQSSKDSTSEGA